MRSDVLQVLSHSRSRGQHGTWVQVSIMNSCGTAFFCLSMKCLLLVCNTAASAEQNMLKLSESVHACEELWTACQQHQHVLPSEAAILHNWKTIHQHAEGGHTTRLHDQDLHLVSVLSSGSECRKMHSSSNRTAL